MNKQKLTYLSPETETLVVRFEGALLQGSVNAFSNQGTETIGYDPDEDL